jgi:hypothetical protein
MCPPLLAAVPMLTSAAGSVGAFATANAGLMGLASAGMGGASAIAGYMGQRSQAKQTEAAYKTNADNALMAYQGDIEASNLDIMSSREAATGRRLDASAEGLAARSAARVGAGESGIGGYTAAALQQDAGFAEGQQVAAINRNDQLDNSRRRLAGKGAKDAAQSRINSAPRGEKPSLLALGASLGSAALSGMQMTSSIKAASAD